MGYNLHITRKEFWADEEGDEITLADWLRLVDDDPEMRLEGAAHADLPSGATLGVKDPSLAVWTSYSGNEREGGNQAWFWWFEGNVDTKNPDAEMIGKMVRIAEVLHARVVGDDGECYAADGQFHSATSSAAVSTPWWKFW